jgi:hypothetical protein
VFFFSFPSFVFGFSFGVGDDEPRADEEGLYTRCLRLCPDMRECPLRLGGFLSFSFSFFFGRRQGAGEPISFVADLYRASFFLSLFGAERRADLRNFLFGILDFWPFGCC